MGKAWDEAVTLLKSNFGLIATIVGLFYFLPTFAIGVLFPEMANSQQPEIPAGADFDRVVEIMSGTFQELYADTWPFILIVSLIQYVGSLSVLALFMDRGSPTVGEAVMTGVRGAPSYLATQIIFGVGIGLLFGLILALAVAVSPLIGILFLLAIPIAIYAIIKLLLVPAVIAMDGVLNPISAMKLSWQLTKGNSLMIFIFVVVIFVVLGLISLVVSLVFGTVFAAFGSTIANIGVSAIGGITGAVSGALYMLILAAIHRQLSGPSARDMSETFD